VQHGTDPSSGGLGLTGIGIAATAAIGIALYAQLLG
jgi:hypothetical protein